MELDIESVLSYLGFEFSILQSCKNRKVMINSVASIDKAKENELSFCSAGGPDAVASILKSRAAVILCKKDMKGMVFPKVDANQLFIFLDNPRMAFMQILNYIYKKERLAKISPTAIISKTAEIGCNCYIGNYVTIGDNCKIGDNTAIYDRVSILENCEIGKNCIIQPGVTVGADGFAFERHEISLELERFPHIGGVIIGDNVEISTNCSVARGSLSDTIIGKGTKLDALVHVAHNVVIGENCELTAGTIVGGSTTIGDSCWTGLNSTLRHKIKIGNKVIIGCGASVIHDVQDEDIVAGVPAKSIKHKVTTNQLFLMAGQKHQMKKDIKEALKAAFSVVGLTLLGIPFLTGIQDILLN
jgi:UDP-3-O-[3-hydroxymyristoyl] glucosamine N-acyltransferase